MKIKKAKKRLVPAPLLKPKRLDLNEHQLALHRLLSELSIEDLVFLEVEIHSSLPPGVLESRDHFRKGLRYYTPGDILLATGLSKQTVAKYIDGFLRIVRREGESTEEFNKRKVLADRPDAPLLANLPGVEGVDKYEVRLVSSRVLIFLILAPTQVRGAKPLLTLLRKLLSEASVLQAGRPRPIHKNSSVTSWEVSNGK